MFWDLLKKKCVVFVARGLTQNAASLKRPRAYTLDFQSVLTPVIRTAYINKLKPYFNTVFESP